MNRSDAKARREGLKWIGCYRPCHKADYFDVMEADAKGRMKVSLFDTAELAELAAWRELRNHEQRVVLGERANQSIMDRQKAEFEKIFGGAA